MKEIWKDIPSYEGLYQVSNLGRIKSFPRKGTRRTTHILKAHPSKKGYLHVVLCNHNYKTKSIHRLVGAC